MSACIEWNVEQSIENTNAITRHLITKTTINNCVFALFEEQDNRQYVFTYFNQVFLFFAITSATL